MNDSTTVFTALAWVAIGIFLTWKGRSKVNAALKKSFAAHAFDTPAGRVTGDALRVVKISKQFVRFAWGRIGIALSRSGTASGRVRPIFLRSPW